jgi:hypothetical protein
MNDRVAAPRDMNSLQFLRYEDLLLQELVAQVQSDRNPVEVVDYSSRSASVERRYRYGQAAKQILRHLALRQCAAIDVASAIRLGPELRTPSDEIVDRATRCRALIDELREILRSHPLMSLNAEGDFAPRLAQLADLAGATIHWELRAGIPLIEEAINVGLSVSCGLPFPVVLLRSSPGSERSGIAPTRARREAITATGTGRLLVGTLSHSLRTPTTGSRSAALAKVSRTQ